MADEGFEAGAGSGTGRRWVEVAEEVLKWTTEVPAVILLVVEFFLLLTGVVARYAFHRPLFWVDELATVLFLWMNMLGAAATLRRGRHMRMAAFVQRASPAVRARIDVVVMVVVATFVLEMLIPAKEYVVSEAAITMPALQISAAYSVSAVLAGMILMLIIVIVRLAGTVSLREVAGAVALVGAACLVAILAKSPLKQLGNLNLILFFVVLVSVFVSLSVLIDKTPLASQSHIHFINSS